MSLPIFQTWPLLSESKSGFDFFVLGGAVVLVGADEGDFLADVFVQELGGLEEIVFVVLFDDAELVGFGERAEMNGGGIHGGGDVHEFEAERCRWAE